MTRMTSTAAADRFAAEEGFLGLTAGLIPASTMERVEMALVLGCGIMMTLLLHAFL